LDHIELRGLRVVAVHGVLPEERQRPQPFEIDLDIEADLAAAGRSDDLSDTVDYGALTEAVASAAMGPPVNLLEHLAERIAAVVIDLGRPRVRSVTVAVRKLEPPVAADLSSAGVRITRAAAG
jgi:dihydroneopterin aldolase